MADWLATLGSWLVAPARVVLHPWWERLVEKKAESKALRAKLLEAIIGFRVNDYQRHVKAIDLDRARGLALRIHDRLNSDLLASPDTDLASQTTLATVEREIELQAVRLQTWVQLASLAEADSFNPHDTATIFFVDDQGNRSHSAGVIFSLQAAFPFTQILAIEDLNQASLSASALSLLGEFCSRNVLPAFAWQIHGSMPAMNEIPQSTKGAKELARGWKPKGN